jgi:hypothetical protein
MIYYKKEKLKFTHILLHMGERNNNNNKSSSSNSNSNSNNNNLKWMI